MQNNNVNNNGNGTVDFDTILRPMLESADPRDVGNALILAHQQWPHLTLSQVHDRLLEVER